MHINNQTKRKTGDKHGMDQKSTQANVQQRKRKTQ